MTLTLTGNSPGATGSPVATTTKGSSSNSGGSLACSARAGVVVATAINNSPSRVTLTFLYPYQVLMVVLTRRIFEAKYHAYLDP